MFISGQITSVPHKEKSPHIFLLTKSHNVTYMVNYELFCKSGIYRFLNFFLTHNGCFFSNNRELQLSLFCSIALISDA